MVRLGGLSSKMGPRRDVVRTALVVPGNALVLGLAVLLATLLGVDGAQAADRDARAASPGSRARLAEESGTLLPAAEDRLAEQVRTARLGPSLPTPSDRDVQPPVGRSTATDDPELAAVGAAASTSPRSAYALSDALGGFGSAVTGLVGGLGLFALTAFLWSRRRGRAPRTLAAHFDAATMVVRRAQAEAVEEAPSRESRAHRASRADRISALSGSGSLRPEVVDPAGAPTSDRRSEPALPLSAEPVLRAAPAPVPIDRMARLEDSVLTLAETVRALTDRIAPGAPAAAAAEDWDSHVIELLDLAPDVASEVSADDGVPVFPASAIAMAPPPGAGLPVDRASYSFVDQADVSVVDPWQHFLAEQGESVLPSAVGSGSTDEAAAEATSGAGPEGLAPHDSTPAARAGGPRRAGGSLPTREEGPEDAAPRAAAGTGAVRRWVHTRPERPEPSPKSGQSELAGIRDEVLGLAARGVPVPEICAQVGLGRHEVQLILRSLFEDPEPRIPAADSGTTGR